jgi:alkaline phosphatase D
MNSLPLLLSVVFLLAPLAATAQPTGDEANAILGSGPMVGYVEMTETAIWLQTTRPAEAQIRYWKADAPESSRLSPAIATSREGDLIATFVLGQLAFGTEYDYEVYLDGAKVAISHPTRFATQAMWQWRTNPPPFRVAVGSCAYINDPPFDRPGNPYGGGMEIFSTIAASEPDLMLWIGDNLYYREGDWESESGMRYRNAYNRRAPELAPLLASTPNYATWDDHDYGPNNSDRTYRLKDVALEIFGDYWPSRVRGAAGVPGVFQRFTWGDIDFFLMDDRYHRAPNEMPPGPGKTMWGEEQLQWLMESLVSSSAPFKVVVNGGQVLNNAGNDEALPNFADYERLMSFIQEARIDGVVFVTGDRHHAILMKREVEGSYPMYDLTTSPLTAGVSQAREGTDHELVVPGTYFPERNFALLEFSGPRRERRMTMRIVNARGEGVWERTIGEGELRFPRE